MTAAELDFPTFPSGDRARFARRWHFVGAGLSNVWRYGNLDLPAPAGRLLLRGPNGTGKTTALEMVWPYLLDLNSQRMHAGKARTTTLRGVMSEGSTGTRRVGYLWFTVADHAGVELSYGVRLQYGKNATPAVRVVPFMVPSRPLRDVALYQQNRQPVTTDEFRPTITDAGGIVFDHPDDYVTHLAATVFETDPPDLIGLASRIRDVRNPAVLADMSPAAAADALRASLPGVDQTVISDTANALAASDDTRAAFERDQVAAEALTEFARVWSGHVVGVVRGAAETATEADRKRSEATDDHRTATTEVDDATVEAEQADTEEATHREETIKARAAHDEIRGTEEFRSAEHLVTLTSEAEAAQGGAAATFRELSRAATVQRQHATRVERDARSLADDLASVDDTATVADPAAVTSRQALRVDVRAGSVLRVADTNIDAVPVTEVTVDHPHLEATHTDWTERSAHHRQRAVDAHAANLAHTDVDSARAELKEACTRLDEREAIANKAAIAARKATDAATAGAQQLSDEVYAWAAQHPNVAGPLPEDIDLTLYEPAAAAELVDGWAADVVGEARIAAQQHRDEAGKRAALATTARDGAVEHRTQAAQLRDTPDLPVPAPHWDVVPAQLPFAKTVDWVDGVPAEICEAVESALAASGALAADTVDGMLTAGAWRVDATTPVTTPNLTSVLEPVADAPASTLHALQRIRFEHTATTASEGFTVGADGSFRTGPLHGVAPVVPAVHIGAERRRDAALARAAELDVLADNLDTEAGQQDRLAAAERATAAEIDAAAGAFPSTSTLRQLESERVAEQRVADGAESDASESRTVVGDRETAEKVACDRWVSFTEQLGLPPDLQQIRRIEQSGERVAVALGQAASTLRELVRRCERVERDASTEPADDLDELRSVAVGAHERALRAATRRDELKRTQGVTIEQIVAREQELAGQVAGLDARTELVGNAAKKAAAKLAAAKQRKTDTAERIQELEPDTERAARELHALLDLDGVPAVVFAGGPVPDTDVAAAVLEATRRRQTSVSATVTEKMMAAETAVAGTWQISPLPGSERINQFVLTFRERSYDPMAAATYAATLAERAEEALRTKESEALRDFVIGRLPVEIAEAWERLIDWRNEVNAKMASVAASSGVGVKVRTQVRDDLSPQQQTVFDQCCKESRVHLFEDARVAAGDAIRQLIDASTADTMGDRIEEAVDIRDWVTITYEVMRPGQPPKKWTARTGLSGGERRLVILAPMLAALAAAHDHIGVSALRMVALDEVPAEVDEHGREGLARYIAALDLDLVCTSHRWDGAPSAWDGIDAYDLDAGSDGTVVAFRTAIRNGHIVADDITDFDDDFDIGPELR